MEDGRFRFYEFGEFRVDSRRRILLKNGQSIPLSPRNFDLLLVMIENEGRLLTHDDLLDKVWEGTFVEQANLKNAISVLRKVLGEDPHEAVYIRTIPRRGYSFVASVATTSEESSLGVIDLPEKDENGNTPPDESRINTLGEGSVSRSDPAVDGQGVGISGLRPRAILPSISLRKTTIAAIVVVAVITLFFVIRPYFSSVKALKYEANNVIITKITSEGNLVGGSASISPNGKYLVYVVKEGENTSLWTRQILTGISRQISPVMKGSIWACALTPDEDFIFYVFNSTSDPARTGLYKISTFGGGAEKISDNRGGALAVAPDGKRLVIVRANSSDLTTSIETINFEGTDVKVVWKDTGDVRIWDIKYSPDGLSILFAIRKQLPDKAVYRVSEVPVDGGPERVILPDQEKQISNVVWLPDRQSLLLGVRELNAELRQIWQYFPATEDWKRVTNDNASYRGLSLTKDGKTVVASQESRLSTMWASDTGTAGDVSQILPGTHYLIEIDWTNDSRLVYSGIENSKESISIINADGTGNRSLTTGEDGIWLFPAPSRDGKHLTYISLHSGRKQLWSIDNDGRNAVQLTKFDSDVYNGRLLSDSLTSIFLNSMSGGRSAVVLQKGEQPMRILAENKPSFWAISPDEKLLVVEIENPQTHKPESIVLSIETGEIIKRYDVTGGRCIRWTPDGNGFAFDVIEGEGGKIMIQPLDGGPPKPFVSYRSEEIFSFDWSMDGKRFAMIRGKHLTDAVKIAASAER